MLLKEKLDASKKVLSSLIQVSSLRQLFLKERFYGETGDWSAEDNPASPPFLQ